MVVLVLERAAPSVRGEVTRWMMEVRAGVFVGTLSALVRDRLWEKVCRSSPTAGAILIFSSNTEQGFGIRTWGTPDRQVVDMEGLSLVRVP